MTALTGSITGEARRKLASQDERHYIATQWQLMARKFNWHRLATVSVWLLAALYFVAFSYEFWAPYEKMTQNVDYLSAPSSRIAGRL